MLGIRQLIVLVNKMDDPTVNWSKERFEEVKQGVSALMKQLGIDPSKIPFIPVSGWTGDNLVERSDKMPWYNGPTFLEALDLLQEPPKPIDKPLRIPIQAVYSIKGVGTVPVGRVETGVLKVGDQVVIMPGGLKQLGIDPSKVPFIPVSGWTGDNLVERSDKMPWYNGPTFLEALDLLQEPPKPIDKPLRIPIQAVYSIKGVGTVPVGRVETGVLKVGDQVVIMPGGLRAEVKSIEMHHTPLQQAAPGDNIGFNLKGVEKAQLSRGMVVSHPDNPCKVAEEFRAQVIIINHPTAISVGYTPVMHIHTAQTAIKFVEIEAKIDPRTGQVVEKNPQFLRTGDAAVVKLQPLKPVALEPYSEFPQLGRFAIRDMGMTIGAGIVREITKPGK
jgi:translation elongation factor EF-1alpha